MLDYPFSGQAPAIDAVVPLAPGLAWRQLPVAGPLRHVNCWLIDDGDGVAIVDTGYDGQTARNSWQALLAGRHVSQVICTHHHPDHSGLAGWLCDEYRAPLVMTRVEWLTLHHFVGMAKAVPAEFNAHWRATGWSDGQIDEALAGWGAFATIMAAPPQSVRRIIDGDVLRLGASSYRVVVGSGHSPEHACLLDEAAGILIAGDQVLPVISPNVSVTLDEPEGDPLGDWLASIERFKLLDAGLLVLPGHGEPFRGLHPRLDALADGHHRRLDRLAALLAEPRRVVDCFEVLFRRPITQDTLSMATGEALAHLRRLEVEGRATRVTRDGVWWFSKA